MYYSAKDRGSLCVMVDLFPYVVTFNDNFFYVNIKHLLSKQLKLSSRGQYKKKRDMAQ